MHGNGRTFGRGVAGTLGALSLVLVFATNAWALTKTVDDPMTNMTITVQITNPSGNNFNCSGRNDTTNGNNVDTLGVSYVCQYKDTSGVWHDFEAAPASTSSNASSTGTHTYSDNPCVSSDGGANLPNGTWDLRGQADGWAINNGNRLDYKGAGAAQVGNLSVTCNN
jgi:hypothetical protein